MIAVHYCESLYILFFFFPRGANPQAHQVRLARLAGSSSIHVVASVDSIWATLAWDPSTLNNFNFYREEQGLAIRRQIESSERVEFVNSVLSSFEMMLH